MPGGTEYIVLAVLSSAADDPHWRAHSQLTAISADQAVRIATKDEESGIFVAIPARSWRPVKVTSEKVVKRLFEAA